MAVYKRSYRPYAGPLTSERGRCLVVPRYALQELVESRVLIAFVVRCLFPFLAEACVIYVANFPAARALLQLSGGPDTMRTEFFAAALAVQGLLAFILAAWVSPVLVSPDLVKGALPLYLSRPFSRAEYVLGKGVALFALLSVVTWVPVLALFALPVLSREDIEAQGLTDVGNIIQRMPSMSGSPIGTTTNNGGNGSVQVDLTTYRRLHTRFKFDAPHDVEIKGKGRMQVHHLLERQ